MPVKGVVPAFRVRRKQIEAEPLCITEYVLLSNLHLTTMYNYNYYTVVEFVRVHTYNNY